ncbi:somatoliberin [Gastrophryne carolinensis]
MARSICLLLLHLGLCVHCYIPQLENSPQTAKSNRNINLVMPWRAPMESGDWSLDEQQGYTRGLSEKRMERHIDAIFTNTYRKVLGQISARRYLQNKMGKRLG